MKPDNAVFMLFYAFEFIIIKKNLFMLNCKYNTHACVQKNIFFTHLQSSVVTKYREFKFCEMSLHTKIPMEILKNEYEKKYID